MDELLVIDPDLICGCELSKKLNGFDDHLIRFSISTEHTLIDDMPVMLDSRKANSSIERELPLPPQLRLRNN